MAATRSSVGLINPSHCEVSRSSPLQEHLLQLSISTHQMIDQHAQTVVSTSRNHQCGLRNRQWPAFVADPAVLLFVSGLALKSSQLRGPAPRDSLTLPHSSYGQHLERRVPDQRSPIRIYSRRALESGTLGILRGPSWEFVRDKVLCQYQLRTTASLIHPEIATQNHRSKRTRRTTNRCICSTQWKNSEMRQPLRVPCNWRDHLTAHVIRRSLWACEV